MVSKEKKLELIKEFGGNDKNSGSIEVQIAILTEDIENLKPHFFKKKRLTFKKRIHC